MRAISSLSWAWLEADDCACCCNGGLRERRWRFHSRDASSNKRGSYEAFQHFHLQYVGLPDGPAASTRLPTAPQVFEEIKAGEHHDAGADRQSQIVEMERPEAE